MSPRTIRGTADIYLLGPLRHSVSTAGDLNGDGIADIDHRRAEHGHLRERPTLGAAYVYLGRPEADRPARPRSGCRRATPSPLRQLRRQRRRPERRRLRGRARRRARDNVFQSERRRGVRLPRRRLRLRASTQRELRPDQRSGEILRLWQRSGRALRCVRGNRRRLERRRLRRRRLRNARLGQLLGRNRAVEILYGRRNGGYVIASPAHRGDHDARALQAGRVRRDGRRHRRRRLQRDRRRRARPRRTARTSRGSPFSTRASGNRAAASTSWNFSPANSARAGDSIATADVNGDGRSDVIVGAPRFDNGLPDQGAVFVFNTPISVLSLRRRPANPARSYFGSGRERCVRSVGGERGRHQRRRLRRRDRRRARSGPRLSVRRRAERLCPRSASQDIAGPSAGTRFGQSVTGAGDVNGDGLGDVVIGAPLDETSGALADEGVARLYLGNGWRQPRRIDLVGALGTSGRALRQPSWPASAT